MSIGPHLLGRHVDHDPRSRSFPAPSVEAVHRKTWRRYGAVLDQGDLGSCTGNAIAQACNTTPLRKRGVTHDETDAVHAYSLATQFDGIAGNEYPPNDGGSSGLGAAKAAQSLGWISGYTHAFGLDHLIAGLMHGPAIVGTDWTRDMFTPDSRGFVRPTGAVVGGHEYLCRGVDPAAKMLAFTNSWGKGWGKGGTFYMTFADFGALLDASGDAVFPQVA